MLDELFAALDRSLGDRVHRQEPLGARTTYRVGGPAALWVEADAEPHLAAVHEALVALGEPVPLLVVGKGSNLLVADAGFPGLVVGLGPGFAWVEIDGVLVRAGGATGYPVVARAAAGAGLRGLEWAVGVPGSVGGALRMNAGGHGSDTAAVLRRFRRFDLSIGAARECAATELSPGYRSSALGAADVVVWAEFSLAAGSADDAKAALAEVVRWRREHQPGGSNAGSVFTNPPAAPAGRLVEEAGCKGLRVGSAEVSGKHANFIQADDGGSADDVRRLIDHVRAVVAERTGVELVPELRMVGFRDTPVPTVAAVPGTPQNAPAGQASPSSGGRG
jgi:UDP-N-acetylmuramate dehydrogenase